MYARTQTIGGRLVDSCPKRGMESPAKLGFWHVSGRSHQRPQPNTAA